jgi:two-component system, OmpR family, response regulator MprA
MAKILVVDDDSLVVKATVRILGSSGYELVTASNGADGLLLLDSAALPDCIVLDVDMPKLTGPEMAGAMVKHDQGQESIPILLVSGRADLAEIAKDVGTPYFLSKGVDDYHRQLPALLQRVLAERTPPNRSKDDESSHRV